jgi:hypothetical protein
MGEARLDARDGFVGTCISLFYRIWTEVWRSYTASLRARIEGDRQMGGYLRIYFMGVD